MGRGCAAAVKIYLGNTLEENSAFYSLRVFEADFQNKRNQPQIYPP